MIKIIMTKKYPIPLPFDLIATNQVRTIAFKKWQLLFHQGGAPQDIYFLAQGSAKLLRHTPSGQSVSLHRARAGEMIAEVSLFSDEYHCDCLLETDCILIAFRRPAVLQLLAQNPDFAAALVQRFARQVQRYRRQMELRSISSAKDRVLAGLSDGWLTSNVMAFSDDMGLSHEATYRALAALVKAGHAQKTGRGKYAAT